MRPLVQTLAYGYMFDMTFMIRNTAVAGGLLIILAHEKASTPGGLVLRSMLVAGD